MLTKPKSVCNLTLLLRADAHKNQNQYVTLLFCYEQICSQKQHQSITLLSCRERMHSPTVPYVSDLIHYRKHFAHKQRSGLTRPFRPRLSEQCGERAFSRLVTFLWNILPPTLRKLGTTNSFKSSLKKQTNKKQKTAKLFLVN